MSFNTISVIGLGYIGLPTAAMFASKEKKVIGVDVNQNLLASINAGAINTLEPGLETIISDAVKKGFLKATNSPEPADAFLIAVPTPFLPLETEGSIPQPDLSYIENAAKAVAKVLKKGDLVILESTSPVGTTEQMAAWLAQARPDLSFPHTHGDMSDIRIAYCPERVIPGHVVRELVDNDRVIGGMTVKCSIRAVELYKILVEGDCAITSARTAEMVKLTENSCRDVQIAFANELSIICDKLEINVWELISLANRHPRINILQPGPGVGGHCIAVDPWFIISKTPDEALLIKQARVVNDQKSLWVIDKVNCAIEFIQNQNKGYRPKVAIFGLTFKADIDDLRESAALKISETIANSSNIELLVVEPNITELPISLVKKANLSDSEQAIDLCDIAVLFVDHKEFKKIAYLGALERKIIIDTRGIWTSQIF